MNIPANWTEGDVDLGNGVMHYYRAGVAGAPAIVLAHGFSDTGLCWQPTAQALAADYDLVMPDARGHGRSARLIQGRHYDLTDDLIRVIQALGLSRPIVFGHSMGAFVASLLAARRPDLASALVLIDPPWFTLRSDASYPMRIDDSNMAAWVRTLPGKTQQQLMEECRREHPTWPEVIVERWCEGKKLLDQNVIDTTLIPESNIRATVEAIHCPVLLLTADPELGGIVTPEVAQEVAQVNPQIQTVRIREAGHHLNFTQPGAYLRAVEQFLSAL